MRIASLPHATLRSGRGAGVLLAAGAFAIALESVALADEPESSGPTSSTARAPDDEMRAYYAGEKTTAFVFVAVGVVSAAAGAVLVTREGDFARGMGWSVLGLGAFEALGAGFYAFQVDAQLAHYSETLARDPAAFKREELTHIHGTTSRFVVYRLSEVALALAGAGVATYGFAANKDAWKGIGIGVAAEALTFFLLDSFGQARAVAYEERVRRFEPTVSLQLGGKDRPWSVGVGGKF